MHLIYSKLKSSNILNGKIEDKAFSVEFLPDKKTKVDDKEFVALMNEEDSVLSFLLANGDFVSDAESANSEIASLKGELKKLQNALKKAEEKAKVIETKEATQGIEKAEKALKDAEATFESCEDASQKKELKKVVDKAKSALKAIKKA